MFTFTSEDGLEIHVHEWPAPGEVRGVVQIAHGMGEHAARYAHLAETLNGLGYAVYADDHRGHGHTIKGEPGDLGENGWHLLVADLVALTRILRDRHPGVPLVLLGHSLGSMAAQQYVLDHADLLDGVVLSGTTAVDGLFGNIAEFGGDLTDFFNVTFEPRRTDADWLSRDDAQVDAYVADPWCGFAIDDASMGDLATVSVTRLTTPTGIPADLPFYVMVGDRDPLNDHLKLSDLAVQRYRDAGLTNLTYVTYPDARHEILNETNRPQVESDLTTWLTTHITPAARA
ncbi:alpha/beta hydrolase [Actinocorallia sp. API 0066]|uniref:alpha/beta fold hydrolase n=1 Tax=Actinocorallia sp. API 0066 TaxID=2896846 RepID=UPI001E4ABAD4|nr:alpha/beta hydrolase [Actinocorallia sp. API 0066]MCD0453456.1 alpha/beta hydrolase [Actinocorallia sp. API 0066]